MLSLRKVLVFNHKVKIVNFLCGTSEKILEKLFVIIKEKPDDLIVHVGTNNITNNVNLLTIQKTLTDTNVRLKNFSIQKGISFILITVI